MAGYLARSGVPVESVPGGYRVFGHTSLSGLRHQIDGTFGCTDGLVIGEWKAYKGSIPKNELLRFKAATDDYYAALARSLPDRPVLRVFGGTGRATDDLRRYAALHGITLIDSQLWPAAVLAAENLEWPESDAPGPSADERRMLAWLGRPMQSVLRPRRDGSLLIPPDPGAFRIGSCIDLHEHWSARLWDALDTLPGRLEALGMRVRAA